jgi:hypothetical protein
VVDLDRDAGLPPDGHCLVDGFQEAVSLGAHVGHVEAAIASHRPADLYQFIGLRVGVRRIDQRIGDAEGAVFHRGLRHLAHLASFRRTGWPHLHSPDVAAEGTPTEKGPHVGRRSLFLYSLQPVPEPVPPPGPLLPVPELLAEG